MIVVKFQKNSKYLVAKTTALLYLIGLLAGCASGGKSDEEKAYLHSKMGSKYITAGQYPAALKEYLTAEKLDPGNPNIQNNLALAYYVRQKFVMAEKHARKAINLKPEFTEARNNLGKILTKMGLFDEAITELTKATEDLTFKKPQTSWSNLGLAYFTKGDYKNANSALQRSLEIAPNHCFTYTTYGRTFFELKDYVRAGHTLDQALKICKGDKKMEAKYYGAIAYLRNKQRQEAVSRLQEIVSEHPEHTYAERAKKVLGDLKITL